MVNMKAPINSVCTCYLNDEPYYMVAGTFNGGVCLIALREENVIKTIEKRHCCYVSSVCTLTQFDDKFVCSVSADSAVIWLVENDDIQEVLEIPLDFTTTGDYKWWEVMELKGMEDVNETLISISSSRD